VRALLGFADRGAALPRSGGGAGRRRQLGRTAAVYLASHARKVWLLARGESLAATMSRYLVERIEAQANIEVLTRTEITALTAATRLATVRWRDRATREETARALRHLSSSSAPIRTRLARPLRRSRSTARASRKPAGAAAPSAGDQPRRRLAIGDVRAGLVQARRRRRRRGRASGGGDPRVSGAARRACRAGAVGGGSPIVGS